jgi:hypothetical protein
MSNEKKYQAADIPTPDDFRSWVQDALADLGLSALSVGRALGLGKNTLGDFLARRNKSIRLETASSVSAYLRTQAALAGKSLPRLGASNG